MMMPPHLFRSWWCDLKQEEERRRKGKRKGKRIGKRKLSGWLILLSSCFFVSSKWEQNRIEPVLSSFIVRSDSVILSHGRTKSREREREESSCLSATSFVLPSYYCKLSLDRKEKKSQWNERRESPLVKGQIGWRKKGTRRKNSMMIVFFYVSFTLNSSLLTLILCPLSPFLFIATLLISSFGM